jgi:hypothetical protein
MEVSVMRMQWSAVTALAVVLASLPAAAGAFDAKAARDTCLERYNLEKEGGTIPAGMSKSKYLSQCTNSIRRAARLELELAQEKEAQAGSNELTAMQPNRGTSPTTTGKPTTVTVPTLIAPK